MSDKVWTTKDGKKIKIKDLTDSHLVNIVNLLHRTAEKHLLQEITAAYSISATLNGEMAQLCCDNDIVNMENMDLSEWLSYNVACYDNLIKEVEKRKLKIAESAV